MFPNSAMTSLWWTECVLGAVWTTQSWPTFREMWPFAMNCFHSTLIADWRKPLSRIKLVETQNVCGGDCQNGLETVYRLERLSQKAMYNCHESWSEKVGVSKIWSLWGFAFTLLLHVLFVCPTLHFFGNRGPRWDPWIVGHFQQIFFAKFHGFFGTTNCTRKPCALHGDTSAEGECFVSLSQYPMSTVCSRHTVLYFLNLFTFFINSVYVLRLFIYYCWEQYFVHHPM